MYLEGTMNWIPPRAPLAVRDGDRRVTFSGEIFARPVRLTRAALRIQAVAEDARDIRLRRPMKYELHGLVGDALPRRHEAIVERRARSRVGVFCDGAAS